VQKIFSLHIFLYNCADCSYTNKRRRTAECLERHTCKWLRRFFAGHLCHRKQHWHRFLCQYICFPCRCNSTIALYFVSPVGVTPSSLYILFSLSVSLHHRSIFCFPCQCHSNIALYSVSPVSVTPPSLYILFPLSVSLHYRSIFCFLCQCHSTTAPHSHTQLPAKLHTDKWSIQRMQAGDLSHRGSSPQQFGCTL